MRNIDWGTFDEEINKLADKITKSGSEFDGAVGLLRGGVVPARLLVARLAIGNMYALNVRKGGEQRVVTTEIKEDLTEQRLLLVEDVLETGGSLQAAEEYLRGEKGAVIATAALYFTAAAQPPDFHLGQVDAVPHFPWES